jgi:hypothetical protein
LRHRCDGKTHILVCSDWLRRRLLIGREGHQFYQRLISFG